MATTDRPTDELLRRVLVAMASDASDASVDQLVDEARAEAREEIKALVKTALKASLLRRTVEVLEARSGTSAYPPATTSASASGRAPQSEVDAASADAAVDDEAPATQASPASAPSAAAGCYVYAITHAAPVGWAADVRAVDPAFPLRLIAHRDVQAVVSAVSLDEFGQAAIDRRVSDPRWVEQKVRAHDEVIRAAMSAGAVIPCRFCTVVRGEADVRRLLATHHDRIVATLETLNGKQEWGVKAFADVGVVALQLHPRAADQGESPAAGRAYLQRKAQEDATRGDAERAARGFGDACHQQLVEVASNAALLERRPRETGGRSHPALPVLNGAYLVADDGAERFHATVAALVERLGPLGLTLEVTGPWPPYNFVNLDLSLEAAA